MERELVLHFELSDSDAISPTEFVGFFSVADQVVRELVLEEAVDALEAAGITGDEQVATLDQVQRMLSAGPVPATVKDVRHSSPWLIVLHIPSLLLAAFVTSCLAPQIKQAWKHSVREQQFYDFFRNRVFGGAKRKVESGAARVRRRPRKGVRPADVRSLPEPSDRSQRLLVRVERTQTLEISISDQELQQELRKRLKD